MRIHKLYQCFAAAVLLFLPVACDNTDYSEKSPFDNSAYLNVAASKNTETFTFNRKVIEPDENVYSEIVISCRG